MSSDDELILYPGRSGPDDLADETPENRWLPAVALEHDAERKELYVIVGEEAAGMAEGVPEAVWLAIKEKWSDRV